MKIFDRFAGKVSDYSGSSWAFIGAVLIILIWALAGPFFHWSDTHQLVINTATTIITFLMVFLIQNAQNREQQQFKAWLQEDVKRTKKLEELIKGRK